MDRDLGAKFCIAQEEIWFSVNTYESLFFGFGTNNSHCFENQILYIPIWHVPLLIPSDGHHTLKDTICWSLPFIWWHLWFTTDSSKVSLLRRQSKVSSIITLLSPFSGNIWANKFLFLSISSVISLISLAKDWFCRKQNKVTIRHSRKRANILP